MVWSPQQEDALRSVRRWLRDPSKPQVFRLFGYAGTGKTTLARELAESARGLVLFGAFTGKAAYVLRKKGCEGARTIHSLIYKLDDAQDQVEPRFVLNPDSDVRSAGLVIIDEVSMVGEDLARDLLSFGKRVLVLGDPAQLPPVRGAGFFTNAAPDVMLTEVHRQAEGSPIIRMATTIREGGSLDRGEFGSSKVVPRAAITAGEIMATDQVLVGLNRTRHAFNRRIRELRGFGGDAPQVGERVICLRNDRNKHLLNGSMWTVRETKRLRKQDRGLDRSRYIIEPDDAEDGARGVDITVQNEFWRGAEDELAWEDKKGTDEFTFGYAITCHKAQGSQWPSVVVFDESSAFRDDRSRWLYTAITRAAEAVTVVVG